MTTVKTMPFWKKLLVVMLFIAVGLVTLVVLFYVVENWRGARRWNAYKQQLEAKGEVLDLKALAPPPVPDDRNFALNPLFKPLYEAIANRNTQAGATERLDRISTTAADEANDKSPSGPKIEKGERSNSLVPWSEYYRGHAAFPQAPAGSPPAVVVLTALSKYNADLKLLHEAARDRPECRFPLRYEDHFNMLLPHLAAMKTLVKTLNLRATAYLHNGNPAAAFEDLKLSLFLADTLQKDPLLISMLVRIAMQNMVLEPVIDGLELRRWTDAQLVGFAEYFGRQNCLAEYQASIRSERNAAIAVSDSIRQKETRALMGNGGAGEEIAFRLLPRGWIDQNKYYLTWLHHEYSLPMVDPEERRVFPERDGEAEQSLKDHMRSPYAILAKMLVPAVGKTSMQAARNQSLLDCAMIACALERYRAAQGRLPEKLDELVPKFLPKLPHDVVTGDPLVYTAMAPDHYLVYSVGWNSLDDGGLKSESRELGDWVIEVGPGTGASRR